MPPVGAVSNRTASAQLKTAPTKHGGVSVYLFLVFTIVMAHKKNKAQYDKRNRVFLTRSLYMSVILLTPLVASPLHPVHRYAAYHTPVGRS